MWTSGPFVSVLEPCSTLVGLWLIFGSFGGFFGTIDGLLVGSLLDRIGFLGHFVIGLSIGIVCVIAELAVGLRQGKPSYQIEEDNYMGSAPWGYRFFERIRMVNQFGEAAERVLIHE